MTIVNKPDMNYGTWAENGNIEIPSSEKVEEGWVVEKPLNEHMNWVQNRQDKMLQYINQRGLPEWDFRTEYPLNAFVVRAGTLYQAISQNIDSDPTLNPDIWIIPFGSNTGQGDVSIEIGKIKNTDGYLTHYVRKTAPVMTATSKGVAYGNSTAASYYGFSGNTPTVTNNGKTVATFSGGTGTNDIVTHSQLDVKLQGYKVGDIYITTGDGDPKSRLGYGTWERFAEGNVLVGFSTSVSNDTPQWVKTAGSKFGSYTHSLSIPEMPKHDHDLRISKYTKISHDSSTESDRTVDTTGDLQSGYTESVGGGEPHNNVQPSIVVYMWKRKA